MSETFLCLFICIFPFPVPNLDLCLIKLESELVYARTTVECKINKQFILWCILCSYIYVINANIFTTYSLNSDYCFENELETAALNWDMDISENTSNNIISINENFNTSKTVYNLYKILNSTVYKQFNKRQDKKKQLRCTKTHWYIFV